MKFIVPDLADPNAHPKSVRQAVGRRAQEVRQVMQEHRERIRPLLPEPLQRLLDTDLHDARFRSLWIDPLHQAMRMRLLCWSSPGAFDLTLEYADIDLSPMAIHLLCLIAHENGSEIYWDEIDREEGTDAPVFIHRLLWQTRIQTDYVPYGPDSGLSYTLDPEIELRFGGFTLERHPNPSGDYTRLHPFITVVRDPNHIPGMEAG